tara:strand:- start:1391 stop:1996 length:606 start_codon:yes stop_codon:yes gene_type:complete
MVLSIRVHELLSEQSNYNLVQSEYKSLIPGNDIPRRKQIYHENIFKLSKKTIELKQTKTKKNTPEIVIDKEDDDELNESEQSLTDSDDENLHINLEDVKEIDNDDKEIVNEDEEIVNEDEEIDKVDKEIDKEIDKDDAPLKMPQKDLMLDLINIIEEKKKLNKKSKEQSVEITGVGGGVNITGQQGGEFKRIKLDQHYNFF